MNTPIRKFRNRWIALFLLLAFIPTFFAGDQFFDFWGSFSCFLYILSGVLIFYSVYCHSSNVKTHLIPILLVCCLNAILSGFQLFGVDFMWSFVNYTNGPNGFMETSTQLGQYSAMATPILFLIHPLLALIPLFSLLISGSSTPILALFSGVLFLRFNDPRKLLILLVALILLVWVGGHAKQIRQKFYTRPIMWERTLSEALKKPFLGWGYNSFDTRVVKSENRLGTYKSPSAYNDFLRTAMELGFIILIPAGLFVSDLFKKFLRLRSDKTTLLLFVSIFSCLIIMCGQEFIRYASVAGTFVVLLALLCARMEDFNSGRI